MFIDLLKFTTKFVRSNFLVFFFVPLVGQKVKKVKSVNIQKWLRNIEGKESRFILCVYTQSKSMKYHETTSKKWTDKKKTFW